MERNQICINLVLGYVVYQIVWCQLYIQYPPVASYKTSFFQPFHIGQLIDNILRNHE
jgi:hypothetical protein